MNQKICILIIGLICLSCNMAITQPLKKLIKLYDHTFSNEQPGGSVLVKKGNQIIWKKSYGISDLKTKKPINQNTIFNTGSISKTVVSYGILILAEREKLNLDDPINNYFEFKNPAITKDITIRHLLSHSSGLPDARNVRNNPTFYLTAKDQENFDPILKINQLNFQPGERFQYSNPAFNGLALIIEKVAEQPWQHFIHEQVFQPAGMTRSKITNGPNPQTGVAHAYVKTGGNYVERDYGEEPTFAAAGNGGIWCSVMDLAKYEVAIRTQLFAKRKTIQLSQQVFKPNNWTDSTPPNIGLSWFIKEKNSPTNEFGVDIYSHTGSQGGFRAFYISVPEKELLYVALFNRPVSNMSQLMWEGLKLIKNENWLKE